MMNFEIGELHPNTPHLFADLAELLLLAGYNGRTRLHANDLERLLTEDIINADELDEEEDAEQAEKSSAERNSRHDRQIEDVMTQLGYRVGAFAEWYPFTLNGETLEVISPLSDRQRIYRLLLASSRLRSFGGKGIPQRWAKAFTELGRVALQGLMPDHATTRIFDANSTDRQTYYGTNLRKALPILGADLAALKINDAECEKSSSSGDAGLDLISVINFQDGASTAHAILGQCGAQGKDWPEKTLEAHAFNFRHFFQMQLDSTCAMFTPVSYRNANGEWVNNKCANGILLADRGRIMNLIEWQQKHNEVTAADWFIAFEHEFCQYAAA